MDKVRILHCADIHFDSPFGNLKREVTKIRQQDIKNTFIKIIKLCEAEDVNILLMCGDVFDNYSVSRDTLNLIRECFERIKDTYIFITPGNHDPINKDSFYNMIEWPSNVHIYGEEIESIYINELNTVVIGAGFSDKYMRESVLKEYFPGNDEECIRIMALHGEVAKGGEKNEYNPITENEILKSKVQYLALGHRHTFSGFLKAGMTTYAYSGCPEGRGFDETGEKGIIIGDVYADGVNLEFKNICERQYFYEDIDVTGANSN